MGDSPEVFLLLIKRNIRLTRHRADFRNFVLHNLYKLSLRGSGRLEIEFAHAVSHALVPERNRHLCR